MPPPVTGAKPGSKKGRQFHFAAHVRADGYERFQVRNQIGNPQSQLVAQVLVIPSRRFEMTVREDQDVMKLDFRHAVTRPDLDGAPYQRARGSIWPTCCVTFVSPQYRLFSSTETMSAGGATSSSFAVSSSGSNPKGRSSTTVTCLLT